MGTGYAAEAATAALSFSFEKHAFGEVAGTRPAYPALCDSASLDLPVNGCIASESRGLIEIKQGGGVRVGVDSNVSLAARWWVVIALRGC